MPDSETQRDQTRIDAEHAPVRPVEHERVDIFRSLETLAVPAEDLKQAVERVSCLKAAPAP